MTVGTSLLPVDDQLVGFAWASRALILPPIFVQMSVFKKLVNILQVLNAELVVPVHGKRQVRCVQCVGREEMDTGLDSCSGSDHIRH